MLYLIQDRDYLKIGYSANVDQRKKAYETTNCYAEIIMVKDGTMKDEKTLHELCKQWHYKNEWFYYNDEIIRIFEEYQPDYNEKILNLEKEVESLKKIIINIEQTLQVIISMVKDHDRELKLWNNEWDVLNKCFEKFKFK